MSIVASPAVVGCGQPSATATETSRASALGKHRSILIAGLVPALAALALSAYVLHLPNVLYGVHEYDDGVYLGAALRLVHGAVPYRDFVVVHPPGIVVLMAPLAALGSVFGSDTSLALARDLTALVAAANVVLAAVAVRHRGIRAAVVAAVGLACFPMAPAADSTLLLEPYLVFFCLLGLVLMFHQGRLAPPRRVLLGGMAIGMAGSVKIWAGLIAASLAVVCLKRIRSALVPFLAGCTVGLGAVCLPFLALAPGAFVRDVLIDQFNRVSTGSAVLSFAKRVWVVSGFPALTLPAAVWLAGAAAACFTVMAAASLLLHRRDLLPADVAVVLCCGAAIAAMWVPNDVYAHYVYFPAAFVVLVVGVCTGLRPQPRPGPGLRRRRAAAAAVLLAVAAFSLTEQAGYAERNLTAARSGAVLNLFVPPHTCVVTDDAVVTVAADLFDRQPAHCPKMVDAFGTWLAEGPAHEPPTASIGRTPFTGPYVGPFPAAFVNRWGRWLSQADWVVQVAKTSSYIPWTPQLRAWFSRDFELVTGSSELWVYKHVRRTPPPVAP